MAQLSKVIAGGTSASKQTIAHDSRSSINKVQLPAPFPVLVR
jgi:hypothetical protein